MDVKRTGVVLKPNCARVLFRPFDQQDPNRSMRIVGRVMELSEAEVDALLSQVLDEFRGRHHRLMRFFLDRFEAVKQYLLTDRPAERKPQAVDRLLLHAGIFDRVGGPV